MKKKSLHKHVARKNVDVCLSNFYTMLEEEAVNINVPSKRKHSMQIVKERPGISPKSLNNMLKILAENDE